MRILLVEARRLLIAHLSDIHIWRLSFNPTRLFSKRALGMLELTLRGRARKFRLERLHEVVAKVRSLEPDHILITGDLTTTALPAEFRHAREALAELLTDPSRVTIVPGNHDRYTGGSIRTRQFEMAFGEFAPEEPYPWLRWLDERTVILGLDPTRSHITAQGYLPPEQLRRARELVAQIAADGPRLLLACHYPVVTPPIYVRKLAPKRLKNEREIRAWVGTIGPHLYCCGHVHAAWAYHSPDVPGHLSLNAGAPLLRDPTGLHPPGFLEIDLNDDAVTVNHHAWEGHEWRIHPLLQDPAFFATEDRSVPSPSSAHRQE